LTDTGFRDQVAADRAKRAEVDDGPQLAAPGEKVVEQALVLDPPRRIEFSDGNDAAAVLEWELGIEVRIDYRIRAGAERDGDRHSESTDDGEPRRLGEHPAAEPHVERGWDGVARGESAENAHDAVDRE